MVAVDAGREGLGLRGVEYFRLPLYTRNGKVGEHVQKKKNIKPCAAFRARGSTRPFLAGVLTQRFSTQTLELQTSYRGFPAALLSRSSPAPSIFTSTKTSKHHSRCTRTHKYYAHRFERGDYSMYVCMYVFIKLHITTQSGTVILVILCHSH